MHRFVVVKNKDFFLKNSNNSLLLVDAVQRLLGEPSSSNSTSGSVGTIRYRRKSFVPRTICTNLDQSHGACDLS